MNFTQAELVAIQNPYTAAGKKHFDMSATRSAMLTMENDARIVGCIDDGRRVDGTATSATVRAAFSKFKVVVDEWCYGEPDFEVMADLFNEGREPVQIPDVIQLALRSAVLTKDQVKLTMQLNRTDYPKLNKVIETLGGKWNKKAEAHVFTDADAEEVVAEFLNTGRIAPVENYGFFPTPWALATQLVSEAGLTKDSLVLEPEAGIGGLADACAQIVPKENIVCYEIQERNCAKLRELGYVVHQDDFLLVPPAAEYSNVVMNPPFSKQQDILHVMHAMKFLRPGGRLDAIMSASLLFRKNRKTLDFLEYVDECNGTIVENEPDAFKESGTLTRTVRVRMFKPAHTVDTPQSRTDIPVLEQAIACDTAPSIPAVPAKRPSKPIYTQASFSF